MIHLFAGPDSFTRMEAYHALRAAHNRDGALSGNTGVLDGASVSPAALRVAVGTAPFLAEYRLVRVDRLGPRLAGAGGRRRRSAGEWDGLAGMLAAMPSTTVLVFLEEDVPGDSPLTALVQEAGGAVRAFPLPAERQLAPWVQHRARAAGLHLTPAGERELVALVGRDLWRLAAEIDKLRLYAGDAPVDDVAVRGLVAATPEATVFQLVDAVVEGRPRDALRALATVRQAEESRRILSMIARQVRMLVVAREILDQGGEERQVREALRTPEFVAQRAVRQARRLTQAQADWAVQRILDADVSIQDYRQGRPGGLADDLAVELLVGELVTALGARAAAVRR